MESLIEYGFVPEFAGRLPIIVPLAPLTKEQMRRALTEPKNSVIKQQMELSEGTASHWTSRMKLWMPS